MKEFLRHEVLDIPHGRPVDGAVDHDGYLILLIGPAKSPRPTRPDLRAHIDAEPRIDLILLVEHQTEKLAGMAAHRPEDLIGLLLEGCLDYSRLCPVWVLERNGAVQPREIDGTPLVGDEVEGREGHDAGRARHEDGGVVDQLRLQRG